MLDGICQAYHWSLEEAKRLTMPQIIMLNHAAWVNQERGERRYKTKREKEEAAERSRQPEDIMVGNRKMSELNSEEIAAQLLNWE